MSSRMQFIHIKSAKFPVLPGEDSELVNEGTYGKALALYLQSRLKERSYDVPFICCEDWGWWVEVRGLPATSGLCVYATPNLPVSQELCVTVTPSPGRHWSWKRFRMVDTTASVARLFGDVRDLLAGDPAVEVLGVTDDFPLA